MCVTNTTRRSQPISLNAGTNAVGGMISQRLLGGAGFSAIPVAPRSQSDLAAYETTVPQKPANKPRPKRRRPTQKPGLTALHQVRHFVQHHYHDHADDLDDQTESEDETHRRRGGVSVAFPVKLHAVLDQVEADGLAHVISWQPHGRCFVIHDSKEFVDHVMPNYFRQSKLTSFQRQLNLYGFSRLTRGPDAGGYYHELFLRGKTFLCKRMNRTKVKGTKFKAASSPEQEPDFYKMKPVVVTPTVSSDEASFDSAPALRRQVPSMSFDPLPVQFSNAAAFQHPVAALPSAFTDFITSVPPVSSISYSPVRSYSLQQMHSPQQPQVVDTVLDDAVEELFMGEDVIDASLSDFIHDWGMDDPESAPKNDAQLGYMLEKLLEDE